MTEEIAEKAAEYCCEFKAKGQTLHIADLLVAAMAFCNDLILVTLNRKDFPMTDDIAFWEEPLPAPPSDGRPRRIAPH